MKSWVDGQPAQHVPLADRGLAYGDGLFETMRVSKGRIPLLPRHMKRLAEGCRRLGLSLDSAALEQQLHAFCHDLPAAVCKLVVTRGDGLRGYAAPADQPLRIILQASALPQWPPVHGRDGVRLFPCQTRLALQPALAGLKHLNRLEQVLARAEWTDPAYAEGLMLDSDGHPVEAVFSNLFIVSGGRLQTPCLQRCGVAGVMRSLLLELATTAGLATEQKQLTLTELQQAQEVFVCNSLYGIWPVLEYSGQHWPAGPVTRALQHQLNEYLLHA